MKKLLVIVLVLVIGIGGFQFMKTQRAQEVVDNLNLSITDEDIREEEEEVQYDGKVTENIEEKINNQSESTEIEDIEADINLDDLEMDLGDLGDLEI
ncbi:MAG: hypothetical protein KAI16_00340 [Candidatus Pacebacteria bacterium]|nr:hypothetical protein [Candidatus Paceibacterota bacterium]